MSLSRIPLEQVFRAKPGPGSIDTNSNSSVVTRSPSNSTKRTSYSSSSSSPPPRGRTGYGEKLAGFGGLSTFSNFFGSGSGNLGAMAAPVRGTRTAQMLEYERQADERAREQEQMNAQEEYEMRQYYEAEALKHAEEVRIHQEGMSSIHILFPFPQIPKTTPNSFNL
jgi:hypothetical protein